MAAQIFYCQKNGPCKKFYDNERSLKLHQHTCDKLGSRNSDLDRLLEMRKERLQKEAEAQAAAAEATAEAEAAAAASEGQLGPTATEDDPMPLFEPPQSDEPQPEPEPVPETRNGRPVRTCRPTWKILQQLPEPPAPLPDDSDSEDEESGVGEAEWTIRSNPNNFGVYREYPCLPTHNPDSAMTLVDLSDVPRGEPAGDATPGQPISGEARLSPLSAGDALADAANETTYGPFGNYTVWGFMNWMWTGSAVKSIGEGLRLLAYLKSPLFKLADLIEFDLKAETLRLDRYLRGETSEIKDGWREAAVNIDVPDGRARNRDEPLLQFSVPGLRYRDLTETIKAVLSTTTSRFFHFTPFRQFWQPKDGGEAQRVHDELFSSDAYIEAYNKLQSKPREPGCTLERCIVALMFASDATHLANFGTASLWPLYLFFGNESKWIRGKPRSRSCHHVAYMPKLPDDFFDWFRTQTGDPPTKEVLAHCRRELLHAIWRVLLDGKFLEACEHGIVIECPDGVHRRFYFRIFTYSADYPEKVLLAAIRGLGQCPCPRCTVPATLFHELGKVEDDRRRVRDARVESTTYGWKISRARHFIYRAKKVIKSKNVESMLAKKSWVPTESAFIKVVPYTWDRYRMLAPDLMHEFELGVWKGTFVHLLRILYAHGGDTITNLNQRFRLTPTFGRDTIRRFTNNTSALKKLAARDYEDILQCALPAFENLLDDAHAADNGIIQDLVFAHAYWHALAKLRMHTSFTLECLREATRDLGKQLRRFSKTTCEAFVTKDLPNEEAARRRKYDRRVQKASADGSAPPPPLSSAKNVRKFNPNTVKTHFLGDYVPTIPLLGTTDSYSTLTSETEHKRGKQFWTRTNKNDAVTQISNLERREAELTRIAERVRVQEREASDVSPVVVTVAAASASSSSTKRKRAAKADRPQKKPRAPTLGFVEAESLPFTPPEAHFHISLGRDYHENLAVWTSEHANDPAFKDFRDKLIRHLLGRVLHPEYSSDGSEYTTGDCNRLFITNNRIFFHKVFRVNYTSYDVRRGQDSMNPRTHADILTLAPEDSADDHPFGYARIIGVYHFDVYHTLNGSASPTQSIHVLFVRRFRLDKTWVGGFKRRRLHRVEFVPDGEHGAYEFVNPDEVIRAAHLVPAYAYGLTDAAPFDSIGKAGRRDWRYHYVNFFVDRDMVMRYLGGAVGHSYRTIVPDPPSQNPDDQEQEQPIVEQEPEAELTVAELEMLYGELGENEDGGDDDGGLVEMEEDEASSDSEDGELDEGDEEEELDFGPEDGENGVEDMYNAPGSY